jgi:hypothetical protein
VLALAGAGGGEKNEREQDEKGLGHGVLVHTASPRVSPGHDELDRPVDRYIS